MFDYQDIQDTLIGKVADLIEMQPSSIRTDSYLWDDLRIEGDDINDLVLDTLSELGVTFDPDSDLFISSLESDTISELVQTIYEIAY